MDEVTVYLVGPTASGKTDLGLRLARLLDAEIVSADSRQVYRRLDAGTAKPALEAGRCQGVPYHLVDCVDPSRRFDVGSFARAAATAVASIRSRGRRALIVGGTGLYVRALLDGLSALPAGDPAMRARLSAEARRRGRAALHRRLAQVDPAAGAAIPPNNIQRVVRALEVYELTGRPITAAWTGPKSVAPLPGRSIVLSLEWDAEVLRERIERRAAAMWPAMLAEVNGLIPRLYTGDEPGFQSLGYGAAVACLRGTLGSDEGLALLVAQTRAYAKRQRTWFSHQVPAKVAIPGGPAQRMAHDALRAIGLAAARSR